ncbi:heavy metal response regulator transcription factor [Marinobacterium sp. D7]|uniref:heavy metal response regulator transcription factor n=1 Tax=Marinobacterium ramblicola TaxID=2849041 RepID=UPI001C2CCDF7|nr:heavy metal response regulator transcription factor [Marinobacterium ramblicola]MBV1788078.1 heavy metal response regulator transcription factor [Marinobacterium ramblicola]
MKILLVEDELKTGAYLKQGLTESGYVVDLADTGTDGLHLASTGEYDLIILDIMLPGLSGWQILDTLRKNNDTTAVIFLTARDQVDDRVRGLEMGANDYLVKPFAFSELLARIRNQLRRNTPSVEPTTLVLADLEVDMIRRRVVRNGQRINLTAKEYTLLEFMLRRRGEVLSRSLIASQVWDMNFDSDTYIIEVAIRRLRSKIDAPFPTKLIHTLRGMGYVMDESDRL